MHRHRKKVCRIESGIRSLMFYSVDGFEDLEGTDGIESIMEHNLRMTGFIEKRIEELRTKWRQK